MNTVDQLRSDINILVTASGFRERESLRRRDEIAAALGQKKKELKALREEGQRVSSPPIFKGLATFGRLWRRLRKPTIVRLEERCRALDSDIRKMISDGRNAEQSRKAMAAVAARLSKTEKEISDLDHAPNEIAGKLAVASQAVAKLQKKKDPKSIVDAARTIVVVVDAWAKAGHLARSRSGGSSVPGRVWLPIPFSMSSQATALGAKQDFSAKGASRFYVELGEPLAKFDSLLPHAFRQTRPKLKFASIRNNAQRQNIWSFMDTLSWDHIRNVNYAMTGRRCILCGKQSGNLVRKLEPDKPNKVGSVECHEVWNWTKPDPDIPVGVQTLERIMVVCFDCHMCFHDDIARGKAFEVGDSELEKQVQSYLLKRRAFLTATDPREVALEMQAEKAMLSAHQDVTTWIVDLSKLAKQDYMYGQTPILLDNNPAGVKVSQIAGIQFRSQDGTLHAATNPQRLYQETASKWITQPEPTYQFVGVRR
jgi:hypothetical protein|nr:hypothetical protein [Neorhizobium tomejilense]